MKQIFTFLLFMSVLSISAQISISKFSLPYLGATLKTYVDVETNVDVGTTGGPHEWDFTGLQKTNYTEVNLEDPTSGSVPVAAATFVIKSNDLLEQYYTINEEGIDEIFIKTVDPVLMTFEISNGYAINPKYRKATILYDATYESGSRLEAALAFDQLPDTLTSGIGIDIDSIRFNTNFDRTDKIDAYGVVKLPDGDWNALRETSTSIRSVTIDILIPILGWIEAPPEILATFLGDFGEFLNPDTTTTINFYSDQSIEVLAAMQMDDDGNVTSSEYKAGPEVTEVFNTDYSENPEVNVYPNPSFGQVTFNFDNCRPGNYTIQVHDILGKEMYEDTYLLPLNNKPYKASFSTLKKGTYLYSIYDPKGVKITTKRLVIVNP